MESSKSMKGDCLVLMKDIPDQSVDMILCDLPYGTTACKWDEIIPIPEMWNQYERIIKKDGMIALTATQPFTTRLISSNMAMFKYCLYWQKPQGVDPFMAKIRPLNDIEDICLFSAGRPPYNPQMTVGEPYKISRDKAPRVNEVTGATMKPTTTINAGDRLPTRLLKIKQERGLHPTQKPVALFEWLIKTYTDPGAMILDNCSGSATTAIACINTGRRFILMENDAEYYAAGLARINQRISESVN